MDTPVLYTSDDAVGFRDKLKLLIEKGKNDYASSVLGLSPPQQQPQQPQQQQASPSSSPQQQQLQQRDVMLNLIASRRNRPNNDAMPDDVFKKAMFEIRNLSTEIVKSSPNGACLFNSISLGMCGNERMHKELRRKAIEYMRQNRGWLIQMGLEHDPFYIQKGFQSIDAYLDYMEIETSHADQYEMTAIAEVYQQPIFVHNLRSDGEWLVKNIFLFFFDGIRKGFLTTEFLVSEENPKNSRATGKYSALFHKNDFFFA